MEKLGAKRKQLELSQKERLSMSKWDFLEDICNTFKLDMTIKEDEAVLSNKDTGEKLEIYEEQYCSSDMKDVFVQYIVCFSTQHRHFDDLSEAENYIRMILTDDVLPIEFYIDGKRKFGGEISKADFERLSIEFLADRFGYTVDYIAQFDYEIHSWSGKNNITYNKTKTEHEKYGEYFMNHSVSDIMSEYSEQHDEWH